MHLFEFFSRFVAHDVILYVLGDIVKYSKDNGKFFNWKHFHLLKGLLLS